MATKAQLKSYFETGDKPLSGEFDELVDSCYGTDQQINYDGTNIRLSNSDGTPDQLANISGHNRQALTYNTGDRKLTLSGNTAANPVGPVLGLWTPTGLPAFNTGQIRYPGEVTVGVPSSNVTPSLFSGKSLIVNGPALITGPLQIVDGSVSNASGPEIKAITTDATLHGASASNERLATEKAIKDYIDNGREQYLFKGEQVGSLLWEIASNPNNQLPPNQIIPYSIAGDLGFDPYNKWSPNTNSYNITEEGWYELSASYSAKSFIPPSNSNATVPKVEGRFYLPGNSAGNKYVVLNISETSRNEETITTSGKVIVKLAANQSIYFEIRVDNLAGGSHIRCHPTWAGRRGPQMSIKKLAASL